MRLYSLNMLAIPLISAKYKRVFSSAKHLVTNTYNRLKANIIEANECLKSWYGRLKLKAFEQGVDPDVDDLYEEEATAKAAAKAAAKKDSNAQGNVDQEAGEGGGQGQGDEGDEGDESQEEDESDEEDTVKYIVVDD